MDREQLKRLLDAGKTHREIADYLGRSVGSVGYWVRRFGFSQTRDHRRAEVDAAIQAGIRTLRRRCKRHGWTDFAVVGSERRLRCKLCRSEAVARRRRKVKRILVREAGGACAICGYDRCVQALEFHHLDPEQKRFGVAARGITISLDRLREEAGKCILLCSNCHVEVESGLATLPLQFVVGPSDQGNT
jgi:hypothetical protein